MDVVTQERPKEIVSLATSHRIPDDAMWQLIATGDLKGLTDAQKSEYYLYLCASMGMNPATQPFEYMTINGKYVLYAKRGAADQLRKIHGVSIVKVEKLSTEDYASYGVTVQDADGRLDYEVGSVFWNGLKGVDRANADMKALTKAKRRATLSICGLGMSDESEVEAIPNARPVTVDVVEAVKPEPSEPQMRSIAEIVTVTEEPVFDGPALKAFAKQHDLNSLPEIEAYVGRSIKGVKAADIRDMILAKLNEQADDTEPLWDRVEPENPKAEQPATKPQIAKIFATAGEKLGDKRDAVRALIAVAYGGKHADQLSKAEATQFIDYLVRTSADPLVSDIAEAQKFLAEAAGQQSLPIDPAEADLITFRERVEAAVSTGEADPLVALFAEAEGKPERWVELIRSTATIQQLNAMIRHASTREQYGLAVSAAAETHRVALQKRADAKRA